MSSSMSPSTIPTIDLTCFGPAGSPKARPKVAAELREALSTLGFVNLTSIGTTKEELHDAFAWSRKLFGLSREDKMKAPHPAEAMPHRGYSGPGLEKVYSKEERDKDAAEDDTGEALRKIEDHKESYEVGSEDNSFQPNIWLPEETLPGYKEFARSLYDKLHQCAMRILDALCAALELSEDDAKHLKKLHSGTNNQLRLLRYPAIEAEKLSSKVVGRMPPHQDWSTFTFLFQDSVGGLELQDPRTKEYIQSKPEEGACILNVGDMLMRYSNGIFPSAMHRVTLPPVVEEMTRERYSIPYFVAPDHEGTVSVLPSLRKGGEGEKFGSVRWCDYGEYMSKHMYKGSQGEVTTNGDSK